MSVKPLEKCLGYSILFIFCLIVIIYYFSEGKYIISILIICAIIIFMIISIIYKIKYQYISENNNIIIPLDVELSKVIINIISEKNNYIEDYIKKRIKNYNLEFFSSKKNINNISKCYICLEDINENYLLTISSCKNHNIHIDCLIKYIENGYNKCGICNI